VKIMTIVGARPQFIKASAISRAIQNHFNSTIEEVIVHTGQHFDANMSDVFFEQLGIPKPQYFLNIGGSSHGAMTGRMLESIEEVLLSEKPDCVLVYGDTNSTLAGGLAASKLHIPVAHVEAGLRSFNRQMPEEINRILTDHLSTFLFCPTQVSVNHLKTEGIEKGVHLVGDVMYDVALFYGQIADENTKILSALNLEKKNYFLVTCHRAENTNNKDRLKNILMALHELAQHTEVVFPIHPRTIKLINEYKLVEYLKNIKVIQPLSYLDLVTLQKSAKGILTDSGGIQKEAFFYQIPCVTLRDETEWVETIELGWNQLVGACSSSILNTCQNLSKGKTEFNPYGNGQTSLKILNFILESYENFNDLP
jgi:UDP-GlcNAc3NAcA epimerase